MALCSHAIYFLPVLLRLDIRTSPAVSQPPISAFGTAQSDVPPSNLEPSSTTCKPQHGIWPGPGNPWGFQLPPALVLTKGSMTSHKLPRSSSCMSISSLGIWRKTVASFKDCYAAIFRLSPGRPASGPTRRGLHWISGSGPQDTKYRRHIHRKPFFLPTTSRDGNAVLRLSCLPNQLWPSNLAVETTSRLLSASVSISPRPRGARLRHFSVTFSRLCDESMTFPS